MAQVDSGRSREAEDVAETVLMAARDVDTGKGSTTQPTSRKILGRDRSKTNLEEHFVTRQRPP